MPFSHHSHSGQFCSHARNTLEEMILQAIENKLRVFCLTEHMPRADPRDLYPEEIEMGMTPESLSTKFDEFYTTALQLREKYKDQITLLIGFEADWIRPSMAEEIRQLRETYKFEIFVGSVHHLEEIPLDFSDELYKKAAECVKKRDNGEDIDVAGVTTGPQDRFSEIEITDTTDAEERMFEAYFDTQYSMLTHLQPPIVGHFDLIRLLCADYRKPLTEYSKAYEKMIRNVKYISSYGGLVEINSAALRKGWYHPYPGPDVMEVMKREGCKFALSDDSHGIPQVGFGYAIVLDYLVQCGVEEVSYFEWKGRARNVQDGRLEEQQGEGELLLPELGEVEMKTAKVRDIRSVVKDIR